MKKKEKLKINSSINSKSINLDQLEGFSCKIFPNTSGGNPLNRTPVTAIRSNVSTCTTDYQSGSPVTSTDNVVTTSFDEGGSYATWTN